MEETRLIDDRFELLEEIGRGGRGVVYRGWHRLLERPVAVKLLREQSAQDVEALKEFRREARILAELKHPHIVEVYAVGALPGSGAPYVVMEFLDGKTLSAILEKEHPLPLKRCVDLGIQIAQGLQYAHEHSIVHRDLKPSNIVVQRDDSNDSSNSDGSESIKIVDFGLAREESIGTGATLTRVVGSPPYMSPEQCLGKHATSRSDLYALGCVLYETICGAPPFSANSSLELMQKHMSDVPRSMIELRSDVPVALNNIVSRLLAKSPDDRYATAAEVEADLKRVQEFLAGRSAQPIIEIHRETSIRKSQPNSRRAQKARLSLLVGLSAVLIVVVGVVAWNTVIVRHSTYKPAAGVFDQSTGKSRFPKEALTPMQKYKYLNYSLELHVRSRDVALWEEVCTELEKPGSGARLQDIADAHWATSDAYQGLNNDKKALAHLQKRAEILLQEYESDKQIRSCADAFLSLSKFCMSHHLVDEALRAAEEGEKVLPHPGRQIDAQGVDVLHARLVFCKLDALWQQGRPAGSSDEVRKVMKLKLVPVVRDGGRAYLVRAYLKEIKPQLAISEGKKALREITTDSNTNYWIQRDIAQAYLELGDYKNAEREFREYLSDIPGDRQRSDTTDQARLGLAQTLHRLKKYDEELNLMQQTAVAQTATDEHAWGSVLSQLYEACKATGNMEPMRPFKEQYKKWVPANDQQPLD